MNIQRFVITAGEDRTLALVAKDRDLAVFDLTGATLEFYLVGRGGRRCAEKTGTIVTAADGTWTAALTESDTEDLLGEYELFGWATVSGARTRVNGGSVSVLRSGDSVLGDYTR